MAEINKRQAFVIEGADILPNDRGTAPGQWVEESGAVAMLLPGPPHELKAMFERQCLPRLARIVPPAGHPHAVAARHGHGRIGSRPAHRAGLQEVRQPGHHHPGGQRRSSRSICGRAAPRRPKPTRCWPRWRGPIELLLGDRVYSRNGDPLEVVVGEPAARKRTPRSAVAESCTGGMLGERFTSVPGSSDYFVGGFITYTNEMKMELLGVPPETLERVRRGEQADGRGHGQRARAGARGSTYALAITGVAGPDPSPGPRSESKPVGTVYVAMADAAGVQATHRHFLGDRARIRTFTTQMALDLLRRRMTVRA